MLKVDAYARIRLAHRDGMSIRAIARTFGHSRHKIRQVLKESEPKPYTLNQPRSKPKLTESFQKIIDEILKSDISAPKKQRHTRKRLFDRLRSEHGFTGGYDAVRRYVNDQRTDTRETFLPISSDAGQRAEADFGQIEIDFPDGRCTVSVLLITWSYSGAVFAIALPSEKVEAILHGTREAYEFFGCVPKELWWDNPKTVAKTILRGRDRELNPHYQSLASHYNFEPLFCLPARGNEKPHVEGRVKWLKRNWATPVPKVNDLDQFNAYLRRCCEQDWQRTISGKSRPIGERFNAEKQKALALPLLPFDPYVSESRDVDKYQTVAWQGIRYSVPRRDSFSTVVVNAYVDRIKVFREGRLIADHPRSYAKAEMILDPLHYLALLERKPAYLDHTEVYKNWRLPAPFADLRQRLEQRHGTIPGSRQFIQVLQMLAHHSQELVIEAIKCCDREGTTTAQRIIFRCGQLAERNDKRGSSGNVENASVIATSKHSIPDVHVPLPDLSRFDAMLPQSGRHDDEEESVEGSLTGAHASSCDSRLSFSLSTETQQGVTCAPIQNERCIGAPPTKSEPQATSSTHDVGRVSQTGARSSRCEPRLHGVFGASDGIGVGYASFQCFAESSQHGQLSSTEGTRCV